MSGRQRQGRQADLPRVVLDTGALIALDEQHPVERIRGVVAAAALAVRRLYIPAVVVAEWWRGDNRAHHRNAKMFKVEPVTEVIAKSGGPRAGPFLAILMAPGPVTDPRMAGHRAGRSRAPASRFQNVTPRSCRSGDRLRDDRGRAQGAPL
jgi:hypothetical protein